MERLFGQNNITLDPVTTLPHFPFTAASRRCRVSCVSLHPPTTYCQYGFLLPHGFCERSLHLRNHLFLLSTPHPLSSLLLHLFTQLCHVLIQIVFHFLVTCHLIVCRSEFTSRLLQFSRTRFQPSFHFFNPFLQQLLLHSISFTVSTSVFS